MNDMPVSPLIARRSVIWSSLDCCGAVLAKSRTVRRPLSTTIRYWASSPGEFSQHIKTRPSFKYHIPPGCVGYLMDTSFWSANKQDWTVADSKRLWHSRWELIALSWISSLLIKVSTVGEMTIIILPLELQLSNIKQWGWLCCFLLNIICIIRSTNTNTDTN